MGGEGLRPEPLRVREGGWCFIPLTVKEEGWGLHRGCVREYWPLTPLRVKERGDLGVLYPGYERGGLGFALLGVRKESWGLHPWL